MSNRRCQICHTMQFKSLLDGHPEFQPMQRTVDVRFDHVNHEQTHFGDEPFDCLRCHLPETRSMSLRSFSNSCGGCHYQGKDDHHRSKIKSATPHVLFQLPYMEVPDDSVWWPEDAALGEELSPMMRLLLGGDDQALEPLRSLSLSDADWILDWWEPDSVELKTDLALAMQRLFRELLAGGQPLTNRLARALEAPADSPQVVALMEQLSSGGLAVHTYQRRWMPELLAGSAEGTGQGSDRAIPAGASGWGMDAGVAAVTYQPTAHADPFLRAWADAMGLHQDEAETSGGLRRTLRTELFEELSSAGFGGYLHQTCLRCHAMDPSRQGLGRWAAAGGRTPQGYRKFDHRTHVKLLDDGSCRPCHEVSGPGQSERSPGAPGAHTKAQCTECHAPAGAEDACLVCHDYHFQRP